MSLNHASKWTTLHMPNGDPLDYSGKYNTPLPPQDEATYQQWVGQQSQAAGRNVANDTYDYDMRGWWKANNGAPLEGGHLTDQYKKPNHPTFSDQSQYNGVDGMQGGKWQQGDDKNWSFTPGATNMYSAPELQDYFQRVEPGNTVNLSGDSNVQTNSGTTQENPKQ
jgi:hypothetical protein